MIPLVQVKQASFSYGPHAVFQDLSFSVNPGQIWCLLGPNGCGKTTLLDCILGLHRLHSGSIVINNKDSGDYKPGKIARLIAYVPQKHEPTFPYSVHQIVTMGRAAHLGLFESPSRTDRGMAEKVLNHMGIGHLKDRPYTQLSGGETQLVMIARALVQEAPVIILDEPTAHLDFRYELKIMEVIQNLVKNNRLSIIMATHFPNHAFYFENADIDTEIALLHKGHFQATGAPKDVLTGNNIETLYEITAEVITVQNGHSKPMKHIVPLGTTNKSVVNSNDDKS